MEVGKEFFGIAIMQPEYDENQNSSFNWLIVDPEMTLRNKREIEDGDFLEIIDNHGRPLLKKQIFRDYDSYYHSIHKRQLHNGMAIKWAPRGIALDFWINLFRNNNRARLIKAE